MAPEAVDLRFAVPESLYSCQTATETATESATERDRSRVSIFSSQRLSQGGLSRSKFKCETANGSLNQSFIYRLPRPLPIEPIAYGEQTATESATERDP